MQEKQVAGVFLEIFVVVVILGLLSAVAVPHVSQMMSKSKFTARETEFQNIQTAVIEMLHDSIIGTLEPVGPTADMSWVHTTDTPPLILTDYLLGVKDGSVRLGCTYSFSADGTVNQIKP
jgi:type II secretory pathway pseudopilin PulG